MDVQTSSDRVHPIPEPRVPQQARGAEGAGGQQDPWCANLDGADGLASVGVMGHPADTHRTTVLDQNLVYARLGVRLNHCAGGHGSRQEREIHARLAVGGAESRPPWCRLESAEAEA